MEKIMARIYADLIIKKRKRFYEIPETVKELTKQELIKKGYLELISIID